MAKLIMAYWDCPVCGAKGIAGDVMNCPACGRARGEVTFYMKGGSGPREADERADLQYLSQEKAEQIGDDPDWYCSFCNSLNNAKAAFCGNCGATKAASEANYFDIEQKKKEAEAARQAAAARPSQPAPKASKRPLLILLAVIIALAGILFYRNMNTTRGDLTVTATNWVRAVQIEENRQKSGSGWSVPAGAEVTQEKKELYANNRVFSHYENRSTTVNERVLDHYETYYTYEDRGNGTFEEVPHQRAVYTYEPRETTTREAVYKTVPQYETKYYYTYWQWEPSRVAEASGSDHSPAWPEITLAENEREGQRTERYTFTVTDAKGKATTYALAEEFWNRYPVDSQLDISVKRNGSDAWIIDGEKNRIAPLTPMK